MRPYPKSDRRKSEKSDKHRINEQIRVPEVLVIGASGEQLGILKTREALTIAEEQGLDLVEVSPDAHPPVCKLVDYGKLRYKEQKRAAEARKKTAVNTIKELRVRYNTDKHDLDTKIRKAADFLKDGDRVKFEMRFKGREAVYEGIGREMFTSIITALENEAVVEERSRLLGNKMFLTLAPK